LVRPRMMTAEEGNEPRNEVTGALPLLGPGTARQRGCTRCGYALGWAGVLA
jgi:hypothetical protein